MLLRLLDEEYARHPFYGSQDDLWNGAWGLLRAFQSKNEIDPTTCENTDGVLKVGTAALDVSANEDMQGRKKIRENAKCKVVSQPLSSGCDRYTDRMDGCHLKPLPNNPDGKAPIKFFETTDKMQPKTLAEFCKQTGRTKYFDIEAWQVKDLQPASLYYDEKAKVYDPDALIYAKKDKVEAYKSGAKIEPLVLRVNADQCVDISLTNHLVKAADGRLPDAKGDALMPKITCLNVDADNRSDRPIYNKQEEVPPSNRVGLHTALLSYDVPTSDGSMVGLNSPPDVQSGYALPEDGEPKHYLWYAGSIEMKGVSEACANNKATPQVGGDQKLCLKPFERLTVAPFTPADPIGQTTHGLFGAVIVYPKGEALPKTNSSNLSATGQSSNNRKYQEWVFFYQDGLNLHQDGKPIPDCFICDDAYDFGDKGMNYHSHTFWQRLGIKIKDAEKKVRRSKATTSIRFRYPRIFMRIAMHPCHLPILKQKTWMNYTLSWFIRVGVRANIASKSTAILLMPV